MERVKTILYNVASTLWNMLSFR